MKNETKDEAAAGNIDAQNEWMAEKAKSVKRDLGSAEAKYDLLDYLGLVVLFPGADKISIAVDQSEAESAIAKEWDTWRSMNAKSQRMGKSVTKDQLVNALKEVNKNE